MQGAQQRVDWGVRLLRRRAGRTISAPYAGNGYHYQAEEVRRMVGAGLRESPVMPLAESVHIVETMERARRLTLAGAQESSAQ